MNDMLLQRRPTSVLEAAFSAILKFNLLIRF